MSAIATATHDEADIRRTFAAWTAAVEARDLDGITANHTADSVLYDAIPPYKTIGKEAIRQAWANCLPYFPEAFATECRDIIVHVAGDVGVVHGLFHFVPTPADDPSGQTWMRMTIVYRRSDGIWKVLHEHVSVPFNPLNNQAWFIKQPDVVDGPDYGQPSA